MIGPMVVHKYERSGAWALGVNVTLMRYVTGVTTRLSHAGDS